MPRRKRHFVFCRKGLHKLSQFGGRKEFKRKRFEKGTYVVRFCLKCRSDSAKEKLDKKKQKKAYERDYYYANRSRILEQRKKSYYAKKKRIASLIG